MEVEKIVEKPVTVEKRVEVPVYMDRVVEKPVYIEVEKLVQAPQTHNNQQ